MQLPLQTLIILLQSLSILDWLHSYPFPHLSVSFIGAAGDIPFLSKLLEKFNRAAVQLHLDLDVPHCLSLGVIIICIFGVEELNDELEVVCDVLSDHLIVL